MTQKRTGEIPSFSVLNELFSVVGSSLNLFDLSEIVAVAAAVAVEIVVAAAIAVAIVIAAAIAVEVVAAASEEGKLDAELLAYDDGNSGNGSDNGKNDEDLLNDVPSACSFVFNSYKFVLKHNIFTSEYYINCILSAN